MMKNTAIAVIATLAVLALINRVAALDMVKQAING